MTNSLWQTLLKSVLETEEHEISCEKCFTLLDQYADILMGGGDPAKMMPMVRQHLKQCNCCDAELEALMIILQEAAKKDQSVSS
jgi:hypothetical protein